MNKYVRVKKSQITAHICPDSVAIAVVVRVCMYVCRVLCRRCTRRAPSLQVREVVLEREAYPL